MVHFWDNGAGPIKSCLEPNDAKCSTLPKINFFIRNTQRLSRLGLRTVMLCSYLKSYAWPVGNLNSVTYSMHSDVV